MIEALAWTVTLLLVLSIVPALVLSALVVLIVLVISLLPWAETDKEFSRRFR